MWQGMSWMHRSSNSWLYQLLECQDLHERSEWRTDDQLQYCLRCYRQWHGWWWSYETFIISSIFYATVLLALEEDIYMLISAIIIVDIASWMAISDRRLGTGIISSLSLSLLKLLSSWLADETVGVRALRCFTVRHSNRHKTTSPHLVTNRRVSYSVGFNMSSDPTVGCMFLSHLNVLEHFSIKRIQLYCYARTLRLN